MVTTTPGPNPSRRAPAWLTTQRLDALRPAVGAALLVLLAFITTGGALTGAPTQVPNSWADAILIVAGGAGIAALVIRRRDGGGTVTFALFAAMAVLTALSIAWSVAPDQSWEESGRTLAYLSAFGIALIYGRLRGTRTSNAGAVVAITLAAITLCVWALAVKALDLNLYGQPDYGPLLAPLGYWNATGLTGAMVLPGCTYLAARRGGPALLRGLAVAGVAIGATVVALTYSRSALAAAVIAAVLPLFFIAERRRAVPLLALGVLGSIPAWIFADANHNISADTAKSIYGLTTSLPIHRGGAGLILGLILVTVIVVLTLAGAALSRYLDTHPQAPHRLARYDRGLLALVAAVPVLIVLWLVFNHRGPTGEISHIWHSLTSVPAGGAVGDGASRIGNLNNSRAIYWREAFAVGAHHLLGGAGAGAFAPAYLHYNQANLGAYPGQSVTTHAHSYLLETFATLGLIGVVLMLGLFGSWCADARIALRRSLPADRGAVWALIAIVIAFGVSSALDWTWYYPGVAVPGLLAAGWIAGIAGPRRGSDASLAVAGLAGPATAPPAPAVQPRPRPLSARPGAILALTLVAVATLAAAWESLQPMRATQSIAASLQAQARQGSTALADARAAVSEDPLSALALEQLADVYGALKEPARDRAELVKATQIQPESPQPFVTLGGYLLCQRHDYSAAIAPLQRAATLDVTNANRQINMLQAAEINQLPAATYCGDY